MIFKKVFRVPTFHPVFNEAFRHVETLREIADSYDPQLFTAALKPDHDCPSGTPAFAWFHEIKAKGDVLEVAFDTNLLTKAGFNAIMSRNFRTLSPEFYPPNSPYNPTPGKWHFKALAYLGASTPAGKGIDTLTPEDLVGFTPPAEWKTSEALAFDENEELGETYIVFDQAEVPALNSLDVADSGTAWNGGAAAKRVQNKYGWPGLRAYSLYKDPQANAETFEAYKFLVVDVIGGTPQIVPKAVGAGLAFVNGARGANVPEDIASKVKPKLEKLQKKIEKTQTAAKNSEGGNGGKTVKRLKQLIQSLAEGLVPPEKLAEFTEKLVGELSKEFEPASFSENEPTLRPLVESLVKAQAALFTEQTGKAKAEAEAKDAKEKLAAFAEKERKEQSAKVFDRLREKGKVPPKFKERFVGFCEVLTSGKNEVTFSEAGKETKRSLLEEVEALFSEIVPDNAYTPSAKEHDADKGNPKFSEYEKIGKSIADSVNPRKEK